MSTQVQLYRAHDNNYMFSMYCKAGAPRKDEFIVVTVNDDVRRYRVEFIVHDMDKDEYQVYVSQQT